MRSWLTSLRGWAPPLANAGADRFGSFTLVQEGTRSKNDVWSQAKAQVSPMEGRSGAPMVKPAECQYSYWGNEVSQMLDFEVAMFSTIRLRETDRLNAPRETSVSENSGSWSSRNESGSPTGWPLPDSMR